MEQKAPHIPTDQGKEITKRVLAKGGAPSLSPLAVRLVEMAASESASAQDLAGIIEQDPGLATRLLRLVNSVAYRRSEDEITSISRAVVLLGLREVRIMALSISLRDTLPVKKGGPDYHLFWRASLHRAVLARETARLVAKDLTEEAFVAGLLLELGLPLLLKVLTEEEAAGFPGMDTPLGGQLAWERENLGLNHRQLGEEMLRHWGLPESLTLCQRVVSGGGGEELSQLTRVSDFARRAAESFFLPECPLTDIHKVAKDWFGLDTETVNKLLAEALSYVGGAAQGLEIELDQDADLLAVMEKANSALIRLSTRMEPHLRQVVEEAGTPVPADAGQRLLQEQAMVNALEAVVHEIRNPLMSVGGFARRLVSQMETGARTKQYAEVIVNEAARLDQVLSQMTSLVSPYNPQFKKFDLIRLLESACRAEEQGPEGRPRHLLEWHLPAGPVEINADPDGLELAFSVLISYGRHLLRPAADAALHVHLRTDQEKAVVTVFGPGLSPDVTDDPLSGKHFGPELEMVRARRIVEAHQGYISTASAPNRQGFVLTASLPRSRQDASVHQSQTG